MMSKKSSGSIFKNLFILCSFLFLLCHSLPALSVDRWAGIDESVVEKFAKEHGREAREPLINTDQGDLLLFVFLIFGALAGFLAGYYWRGLIENPSIQKRTRDGDIF